MFTPANRWISRCRPPVLPPAVRDRMAGRGELPGPDGVRWALVNRVKAEIAAGTYDTPDRWAAAEAVLLRRTAADD